MGLFGGKGDNERALTGFETDLIRKVFQTARLPSLVGEVSIADGENGNGGPWTDSDYQINVTKDMFDLDLALNADRAITALSNSQAFGNLVKKRGKGHLLDASYASRTLVHEMTHVWQYYNGTLTKGHAFIAHARAGIGDFLLQPISIPGIPSDWKSREEILYSYDVNGSWDDMGFEGQAQLVEDWYANQSSLTDDRYLFIRTVIHKGIVEARSLPKKELAAKYP